MFCLPATASDQGAGGEDSWQWPAGHQVHVQQYGCGQLLRLEGLQLAPRDRKSQAPRDRKCV